MFNPRPMQAEILNYTGGRMGVSAVPGSGKTHTLSYLAAKLIAGGWVRSDQEVLIVTLVNSAVNNFATRVDDFIQNEFRLLPNVNYRVRTLHGLARDIVSGRTDLAGLSNRFGIVDELERDRILGAIATAYIRSNPSIISYFSKPDMDDASSQISPRDWSEYLTIVANSIIRTAKDLQVTPAIFRERFSTMNLPLPLMEFGVEVYTNYQRALNFRGAVDFDDLIRLGLQVLTLDPEYLGRLRYRWPYILEDESQDSSRLQEDILRRLVGEDGNWVRVGDPNQAIFETFTTASPEFLINFRREPGVVARDLPNSGRSTLSIIRLANGLIHWTNTDHPVEELRDSLTTPYIEATPPGDPQPNPPDQLGKIFISSVKYTPEREVTTVVDSLKNWLPIHPGDTVAILVPTNGRGEKYVEALKKANLPYFEILKNTQPTRRVVHILTKVLQFLSQPTNTPHLSKLIVDFPLEETPDPARQSRCEEIRKSASEWIKRCSYVEDFLYPLPGRDWLESTSLDNIPSDVKEYLSTIRPLLQRWTSAVLLPIDQLILTISVDLFTDPIDLALGHSIAIMLEYKARSNPSWHLEEFAAELAEITRNQGGLLGFSRADSGFNPDDYRGTVIVTTIHKAKGLEWDRVHLTSVSNYDFPAGQSYDEYVSEKWFIRNRLNLQAEAVAQTKALLSGDKIGLFVEEGWATQEARISYCSERLRLLFVGITRARKELIITWNTGKSRRQEARMAQALVAIHSLWENGEI